MKLNRKAMYDLVKLNNLKSEIFAEFKRSYQTLPDFLLHDYLYDHGYIEYEEPEIEEDYDEEYNEEYSEELCDEGSNCGECEACDFITIPKENWYAIKALVKALNLYF